MSKSATRVSDKGGTMRLGAQECRLKAGTLARELYGQDVVRERHRHRYEFNNRYRQKLEDLGLVISGKSMDDLLVEMIELAEPSVVPRLPGPSRIHLDAARRPSAVRRLHSRRTRVQGRARGAAADSVAIVTLRVTAAAEHRMLHRVKLCDFEVGLDKPLFLIAGPCVIESEQLALDTAGQLKEITARLGIPFIYKSSFDKANRTSISGHRGPGIEEGLRILAEVKRQIGVPVLTDVHEYTPMDEVADVVDVLQTPAFLCRQTDFILKACSVGRPVNIKKGQFLSPWEMKHVADKAKATGNAQLMVCERGASFGYNNLVSDMRSLAVMRDTGCPVVFDATHSVQLPGGADGKSGGQREFVPVLARAAVAVGIAGIFMETHPDPDKALSDGPNAWPLGKMPSCWKLTASIAGQASSLWVSADTCRTEVSTVRCRLETGCRKHPILAYAYCGAESFMRLSVRR